MRYYPLEIRLGVGFFIPLRNKDKNQNCMIQVAVVEKIVEELLVDKTTFLVDVKISGDNFITVVIDDDKYVDLDFCVELHRAIETQLDREVEDYSLEVGSAGLTAPYQISRQYIKNIGQDIEILNKAGKKFQAKLIDANQDGFTAEITTKVKPEGAKRKVEVTESLNILYTEVKYVKSLITFK